MRAQIAGRCASQCGARSAPCHFCVSARKCKSLCSGGAGSLAAGSVQAGSPHGGRGSGRAINVGCEQAAGVAKPGMQQRTLQA